MALLVSTNEQPRFFAAGIVPHCGAGLFHQLTPFTSSSTFPASPFPRPYLITSSPGRGLISLRHTPLLVGNLGQSGRGIPRCCMLPEARA